MNGNDMAFPVRAEDAPNNCEQYGLTKREYFAAKALQGLCANESFCSSAIAQAASLSVLLSDALIEELSK